MEGITFFYRNNLSDGILDVNGADEKVDADLIEIARFDIREAMRKEILKNQNVIDGHLVNRSTPRSIKEVVFYAMARNNAIINFLKLLDPAPENLHDNVPSNEDYWIMMRKVGASKYPLQVKRRAEWDLYYDYTHDDYKRHRFWWVLLIIFIGWGLYSSYDEPSSYSSSSSGHNNTFGSEGISRGNSGSKSDSDSPQVKDNSGQSGFGNGGVSGSDSADGDDETFSINSNDRPVLSYRESLTIGAHYFLPNSGGNGYFTIAPGDRVETFSGEQINIDFDVPIESDPLIKLNDLEIDGWSTATNPNITWITFTAVEGENKVSIKVDDSNYEYFFDAEK
ncbi:hypothetical protein [Paenibacillus prosopidis]|uniref:hypothetical protein n=1 Tax=Paenibacillus prosopidis TaxID=630520 RepID=UPI0011C023DC|nr:hypothetical protein [Paenibacillus prosopidis]